MNKIFYPKLALNNIRKNSKTYVPYIITCVVTIMMFYMMLAISQNEGLENISGAETLRSILYFGIWIIGIFSAVFLFYTNSFLVKRRKKEFGIYNILGMEKKHIAKVLSFETIFVFLFSIIVGILCGMLFSKLIFLFLLKILNFDVPLSFSASPESMLLTAVVFGAIFILTLIFDILQISVLKPIELLYGGNQGEKEPKTKWIIAVLGLLCLAAGYTISLTIETPLSAVSLFFVAVVLVMVGTYCLFTAGSIAILKGLKKNKKYYYKTKHFTSVSGMIYRMKQNATGLANICILSTAVILVVSSTISLYIGIDDAVKNIYPREVSIMSANTNDADISQFDKIFEQTESECNFDATNELNYRCGEAVAKQDNNNFAVEYGSTYAGTTDLTMLEVVPLSDYNKSTNQNETLNPDEVLIFDQTNTGTPVDLGNTLNIFGNTFNVKSNSTPMPLSVRESTYAKQCYCVVCNDMNTVEKVLSKTVNLAGLPTKVSSNVSFDNGSDGDIHTFVETLQTNLSQNGLTNYDMSIREDQIQDFYSVYGSLFFVGLFLGLLFLMVTVLIIYYKQISEGYDDKERFTIMQNVGMSKGDVKQSIRTQILMVFFIPLIVSIIHMAFAFPIVTKILEAMNLTNVSLFVGCTIATVLVFSVLYVIVYTLTARVYYKIVEK